MGNIQGYNVKGSIKIRARRVVEQWAAMMVDDYIEKSIMDWDWHARMRDGSEEVFEFKWEAERAVLLSNGIDWRPDHDGRSEITGIGLQETHYFRPDGNWRVPVAHIALIHLEIFASGVNDPITSVIVGACGSASEGASQWGELPNGMEICQPCAEAIEFVHRRDSERILPDRASYNDRTRELLSSVGMEIDHG